MASHRRAVEDLDLSKLRELLSGTQAQVLTSLDPGYEASMERWSRAAIKPAGVSIVPTTSEEVAVAIKYASENNLDVAVKGGGHSTAGASSTNGGLLIDLGGMRKVDVDVAKQRLHVQGGCLWMDVDEAGWKHGLATVGGTVADTGVGGLTLGGGYGMLSGQRGLVIDNTVAATVVTSNGEINHASKTENPDLFWALNGAGQNFGVTTEFVLQAYPQKDVYMGTMIFAPTPENITKLVTAINDLYEVPAEGVHTKTKGKLNSLLGLGRPPQAGGQTVLLFIIAYDGQESKCKQLLKPILDIGPVVNTCHTGPYPEVNSQIPTVPGFRSSMKGAAYVLPIRPEFVTSMVSKYNTFMDSQPDAAQSLMAWEIYDPTEVVKKEENGCFANRGYHMNSLIMPMWSKPENDSECRQFARDVSLEFKKELEAHGQRTSEGVEGGASVKGKKGAVLLYGNYDQYDEISKDIFGDNYPRLQEIKAKYDPTNMFNKLFPIQPKPSSARIENTAA
ncbi:Uu.00g004560.m01.CDS01 [Anthostomella pinea]|uniref:Uu.00g004560.m01.CDS01 n=1 Tax=Anthostomella pinea TaxID=933095 RepID=A0AAI8VKX6_9PEZI|nr:Uu.00g004560.m01.CDS01 [Anthostomella pinea]